MFLNYFLTVSKSYKCIMRQWNVFVGLPKAHDKLKWSLEWAYFYFSKIEQIPGIAVNEFSGQMKSRAQVS